MFYRFDQNNSYGHFEVNENLCHRLFIEADSENDAISKAESLGCYWDGVANGIDCPCCGDRWNCNWLEPESFPREMSVSNYSSKYKQWYKKYGSYEIVEQPTLDTESMFGRYVGKIRFNTIEEYAQYLANEYGWTTPDVRIFYKDGTEKEIFSHKGENI